MAYWLLKSEPYKFSWDDQCEKGEGRWEKRVRNYQARNNLQAMTPGDQAFFYHSNEGLNIVGIAEVSALSAPDSTTDDERWDCVHIKAVCDMPTPVSLKEVKANPKLSNMSLVTSMRLSVQPVTEAEWIEVCRMGDLDGKTLKPM